MAIKLKAPYGVKDSALEQNRKHKINIEDWLGQLNAEFDKFYNLSEENKQDVLQELINYAREQATIDAKQDEEIIKKALASELRAEEKARDEADKALTQELGDVKNTADSALRKANSLEHKGMYIGTYETLALADAQWPTKEQGDFVLIGASAPYQEYIWTNGAWEQAGIVNSVAIDTSIFANKDLANVLASIFKQKGIDAGLATQSLVDSKTTSYDTLQAGKYYLLKTNQDLTRSYWEFDPQAHVKADEVLHTTITTETDAKLENKQDKITTTTITIPAITITRTKPFHIVNNDASSTTSVDIGDNWLPKRIVAVAYCDAEANLMNTIITSETETQSFYKTTQRYSGLLKLDTKQFISTKLGGSGIKDIVLTVEYEKTIPEQTFKVIA